MAREEKKYNYLRSALVNARLISKKEEEKNPDHTLTLCSSRLKKSSYNVIVTFETSDLCLCSHYTDCLNHLNFV